MKKEAKQINSYAPQISIPDWYSSSTSILLNLSKIREYELNLDNELITVQGKKYWVRREE